MNLSKTTTLLLALITSFALAGCSDDTGHGGGHGADRDASNIAEAEDFNQADVDFATDMIQHHAQALVMVDLTDGKKLSPELTALAEQIRAAQGPEIETMVDFLNEWDQPIPETMRDHVNGGHGEDDMGGMGDMGGDMPGMASPDDLAALADAEGEAFEQKWLELMIAHHEGALEMASTEQEDGEYAAAIDLAKAIESAQQDEIALMEGLQDS